MEGLLSGWGCQVLLASSAEEAQQQMERVRFQPDVIIADYCLLEQKTGMQAIQLLREYLDKNVPGILISGQADSETVNDMQGGGFQWLSKPVNPVRLKILLSCLARSPEMAASH